MEPVQSGIFRQIDDDLTPLDISEADKLKIRALHQLFNITVQKVYIDYEILSKVQLLSPPIIKHGFYKVIRITEAIMRQVIIPFVQKSPSITELDLTFVDVKKKAMQVLDEAQRYKAPLHQITKIFITKRYFISENDWNICIFRKHGLGDGTIRRINPNYPKGKFEEKTCKELIESMYPYGPPSNTSGKVVEVDSSVENYQSYNMGSYKEITYNKRYHLKEVTLDLLTNYLPTNR